MDAWWDRALEAAFRPVLGSAFDDVPHQHDDPPGPVGSAYIAGWYGQLQKDLRSVLGLPVEGAFHRQYCGEGEGPAACRAANEEDDFIPYAPLGVPGQRPMQWQNRPTFQQVLEFARKAGVVGRR